MATTLRPALSPKNQHWISKHRYYELKHFCLQYPEWRENCRALDGYPTKSMVTIISNSETSVASPTEATVEARLYYQNKMMLIETTAEAAAGDLHALLLKAVTEGRSYEAISPPCCKDVWYGMYRRFFWLLDKARK